MTQPEDNRQTGAVSKYFFRPMQDDDIPQALNIDHEAFATQWPPLSYTSLKQELRNRMARYVVLCTREPKPVQPAAAIEAHDKPGGFWYQLRNLFHRDHRFQPGAPVVLPSALDFIIGFAGIWKIVDEAHLITIAVKNDYRGEGFGEFLLIHVIELAQGLGAKVVTLEVRVSNKRAQGLYVKYGFRSAGVRHAYYSDNGEDALIMTSEHISSESFRPFFTKLKQAHTDRWREARVGR